MNTLTGKFTTPDTPAAIEERRAESRAAGRFAVCVAALLAGAVALSGWLIVSSGTTNMSSAAAQEQLPRVPYFPSQYVNQATEPSPAPPTF